MCLASASKIDSAGETRSPGTAALTARHARRIISNSCPPPIKGTSARTPGAPPRTVVQDRSVDRRVVKAELHWYEAHGLGRHDFKVKQLLE